MIPVETNPHNVINKKHVNMKTGIKNNGQQTIFAIKVLAWIVLVFGIIGTMFFWDHFAVVDLGWRGREFSKMGMIYSLAVLLYSIVTSFFLFGLAVIGHNLIKINEGDDIKENSDSEEIKEKS